MENKDLKAIRAKLNHLAMEWEPTVYLNTEPYVKTSDLNTVMGHKTLGIPYGIMIEVSGWESMGKTAIIMSLAALAQIDGAQVIWGDLENSFQFDWAKQRGFAKCLICKGSGVFNKTVCLACGNPKDKIGSGLDFNKLILVKPYVGKFFKEREPRLATAQELCSEIEACFNLKNDFKKRFVVLDSVAALETEAEANAGLENAKMNTTMSLPLFMGKLCRRWVGRAQVDNAIIVLINQLRSGPTKKFGDPTYSPGGNAPKFYSQVRIRVRRVAGGKITDKGRLTGITGVMKALKNKSGGIESMEVGYRIHFAGKIEFISAKTAKANETND